MKNKTAADWLAERRRIEQAASEGPWEHEGVGEISQHFSLPEPATVVSTDVACMGYCYGGSAAGVERDEDAAFIADARTSAPKMRAALEAVLALHPWECLECEGIDLDASPRCGHCYEPWPCPTVAAITEALT